METSFLLQNKIVWRGKIARDLSASFYPSFYKDILKKEKIFSENFKVFFEDANIENMKSKFVPIYQAEILSRTEFTLEKSTIMDSITQRIMENPLKYRFLFIYGNDGELYGATLFLITEDKLEMAFRAYRRDVKINALKHKASLDYWGEKLIREYGINLGLRVFSNGRDTHPYVGTNRIGLALYKLKTGTRPKVPNLNNPEKPVETKRVDELFLFSNKEPVVFFDNPDSDGFYRNCFLYYPKSSLHESFVNEFGVVSEWAGITFEAISY